MFGRVWANLARIRAASDRARGSLAESGLKRLGRVAIGPAGMPVLPMLLLPPRSYLFERMLAVVHGTMLSSGKGVFYLQSARTAPESVKKGPMQRASQ